MHAVQVLYLLCPPGPVELTAEEEAALAGEEGEALQTAYRILLATGEATDAERLVPVEWAHVSGVNYNTIGDTGEEFLAELSRSARVRTKTTLNPMGYDSESPGGHGVTAEFARRQESIKESYARLGVEPSFSCIPYEIYELPPEGTRVAFAESNAAIYANSVAGLNTNKESAFSALASALTGKTTYAGPPPGPDAAVHMGIKDPDEVAFGLMGFFAGKLADGAVAISGAGSPDTRCTKSLCAGLGTSGTCSRYELGEGQGLERVDFGREEMQSVHDELSTAEGGDVITLASPQLGLGELGELSAMLAGRRFGKMCMVFCPRAAQNKARRLGYAATIERAGCEILSDCCTCLTPLISRDDVDSVITNSVKGAYYLKNSNRVGVDLRPLSEIIKQETERG
ncbi:conserved hypothetical protein [Cenarchaeum symbiosum A]|uniref:Phosphomevalonate dehydratase large subunit n=1 Tax=Cenarchaeum symbiosum (strain A) TaxID=414004 RepID=A0RYU9_CENSY|nr:conserved hypothetical protein [Cenarchaeum symbiosum A]